MTDQNSPFRPPGAPLAIDSGPMRLVSRGVPMSAARTDMSDLANKPSAVADMVFANCTTRLPLAFQFHEADVGHTAVVDQAGKGMSVSAGEADDDLCCETAETVVEIVVQTALVEKIQRLERRLKELQSELLQAREAALGPNLAVLRQHQCVLMYVGTENDSALVETLESALGPVARDALAHLFVLNNAPLPDMEREAVRTAFNHGMDRW